MGRIKRRRLEIQKIRPSHYSHGAIGWGIGELMSKNWSSTKLWLTVFGITVLAIVAIVGGIVPAISGLYTTFSGGVITALGLYITGNSVQKHLEKKMVDNKETLK